MLIPPTRLALGGGGARGPGLLGALRALDSLGFLRHVKEILGISVGAVIGLCLCLGYNLDEVEALLIKIDLSIVQHLEPEAILELFSTYSLDTSQNIEKFLRALFVVKGLPETMTFADLSGAALSPYRFRTFATDLNQCGPVELSAATTPTFSVLKAVQASLSIPFYFRPVIDEATGHHLVDGSVYNSSPFWCIPDAEKERTLALSFSEDHCAVDTIPTFGDFLTQLYNTLYNHIPFEIRERWKDHIVWIHCGDYPGADFGVSELKKREMAQIGYADVMAALGEGRLRWRRGLKPARRFSVG